MSHKNVRRVLALLVVSLAFGVCVSRASAQSIQACEFQLSIDQYPCASGSAGWPCREETYFAFERCLLGVFPDLYEPAPVEFCAQAQSDLNACWQAYQNCGGFYTDGCWEAYYYNCRPKTGIDMCQ